MNKKEIVINIPGSKSIINRLLIMATYLHEPFTINNFSNCADVLTLLDNLHNLGFDHKLSNNSCTIIPLNNNKQEISINIHDAGTAFRFILARVAAWDGVKTKLEISTQLSQRPIKQLIEKLNNCGADIEHKDIITINGKRIESISGEFAAEISSQFVSSIMLISPLLHNGVDLKFTTKPVSYDYLVLTKNVLSIFGIESKLNHNQVIVKGDQRVESPGIVLAEADYSSASYFWALGALSSISLGVFNTGNTFGQTDFYFWKVLEKMGAEVFFSNEKILVKRKELNGIDIDMKDMPDQVPTLAILSLFAKNKTTISGIDHLRFKESDRISALVAELSKLGCEIFYRRSTLTINPLNKKLPEQIILNTYNDHRLVMAFSILTMIYPKIKLDSISSVSKSFPEFFEYWNPLGENLDIKNSLKDITRYE